MKLEVHLEEEISSQKEARILFEKHLFNSSIAYENYFINYRV